MDVFSHSEGVSTSDLHIQPLLDNSVSATGPINCLMPLTMAPFPAGWESCRVAEVEGIWNTAYQDGGGGGAEAGKGSVQLMIDRGKLGRVVSSWRLTGWVIADGIRGRT